MTPSDIQDLLISRLVRLRGGTRRQWRFVLGPVQLHDRSTHAHCNWSVSPSGDAYENDAVERLLDDVRADHPLIDAA